MNFRKILFLLTVVSLAVAMPALAQTKKQRKINKANYEAAKAREAADTLKTNAPVQFVKSNADSLKVKDSIQIAKAKSDSIEFESRARIAKVKGDSVELKTRALIARTQSDSIEAETLARIAKVKDDSIDAENRTRITKIEVNPPKIEEESRIAKPEGGTPKAGDLFPPKKIAPKVEPKTRIAKATNDTLKFKDRLQAAKIKADTISGKIEKSTGLDAQLPALNPTGNLSLPGGKNKSTSLSSLLGETIPDLGLKAKEFKSRRSERRRLVKKGRLAKVQYQGVPMQKIQVKFGSGDRATIEEFHILKEPKPISPYIRDISWYDLKTKKRSSSVIKDKDRAYPLHGPYKKYKAGELIEEGFYYTGTKDGRWVRYDNDYNLLDKSHWYHGFPVESQIAFYDSAHTKIKEVLPIQFEDVDGEYFRFYDEGQLMTFGRYDGGEKVGRWVEYYQYRRQRKKEVQYRKTRWDEDFEPYVIREWDDQGKLIYDNKNDPRTSAEVDDQN